MDQCKSCWDKTDKARFLNIVGYGGAVAAIAQTLGGTPYSIKLAEFANVAQSYINNDCIPVGYNSSERICSGHLPLLETKGLEIFFYSLVAMALGFHLVSCIGICCLSRREVSSVEADDTPSKGRVLSVVGFGGPVMAVAQATAGALFSTKLAGYAETVQSFFTDHCVPVGDNDSNRIICTGSFPKPADVKGYEIAHYSILSAALCFNFLACISICCLSCPNERPPSVGDPDVHTGEKSALLEESS